MRNLTEPLSDADLDRLELLLRRVSPNAMTVDELDGFFCALVCGPSAEPVSDYFPDALGIDLRDESFRHSLVDPEEISTLLHRHWNQIAAAMLANKPYMALFVEDEPGNPVGHGWARGFIDGMNLDPEEWDAVAKDRDDWILVSPVMLLLADSDPGLAPELKRPVDTTEKRLEVLAATALSLSLIFKHFHAGPAMSAKKRK